MGLWTAGRRVLGALVLLLLGLAPAAAQGWWTVSGIAVDVSAADAVTARQKGLESGQREGLRQLMARLAPAEDQARLPSVETLPIAAYVQSFEIAEEKVAPTRYLATLNVAYDPEAVGRLLRGRGVGVLEPSTAPVLLVVPALSRQGTLELWGREEPWWQAWERAIAAPSAVRLVLPLGDLADLAALSAGRVEARDQAVLDQLAQRYGAAETVVAVAEPSAGDPPATIAVRFVSGGTLLRADPEPIASSGGEDAYGRAALAAAARLVEAWRQSALVRPEQTAEIALVVPLADLAGWVQIRRQLEATPEIREVRIRSVARDRAELSVRFTGDADRLRESLARRALVLAAESTGWQLRPAGVQPATGTR